MFRSDALEEGDYILSVNGVLTSLMQHDDIVNMLRSASDNIVMRIEYELPELRELPRHRCKLQSCLLSLGLLGNCLVV